MSETQFSEAGILNAKTQRTAKHAKKTSTQRTAKHAKGLRKIEDLRRSKEWNK
ncbi:MAG TPA: hypothetical protein VN937_25810 [Blastocatellia bacterium]|nr:hypothetical protein [Blastocatellia bacterium]